MKRFVDWLLTTEHALSRNMEARSSEIVIFHCQMKGLCNFDFVHVCACNNAYNNRSEEQTTEVL